MAVSSSHVTPSIVKTSRTGDRVEVFIEVGASADDDARHVIVYVAAQLESDGSLVDILSIRSRDFERTALEDIVPGNGVAGPVVGYAWKKHLPIGVKAWLRVTLQAAGPVRVSAQALNAVPSPGLAHHPAYADVLVP